MKINDEGLELIKHFEGCRLQAYQDVIGVWTIGYGHVGIEAKPGAEITQEKADSILSQDLIKFEDGVSDLAEVDLNENQFSALVCFAFNIGLGNLAKSGLMSQVNKGNFDNAETRFAMWNKAGGRAVAALTIRREAERRLFVKSI